MTPEFRAWNGQEFDYCTLRARNGFSPQENGIWYDLIQTHPEDIIFGTLEIKGEEEIEQYTGLKDVNGNKIFEGDIVKTDQHGYNQPDSYVVKEFVQNVCVFRSAQVTDGSTMFEEATNGHDLTVIGNIHENPELLEVE